MDIPKKRPSEETVDASDGRLNRRVARGRPAVKAGANLPQPPESDAGRKRFARIAMFVSLLGQIPGAWILLQGLIGVRVHLPPEMLFWATPLLVWPAFLVWMNAGLFVHLTTAFPEKSYSPWLKSLLVLPFFVWFTAAALMLFPGLGLLVLTLGVQLYTWGELGSFQPFLEGFCALLAGSSLLGGFYAVYIRRQWVVTSRHEIPIRGLPQAFDGFRIVQLSDLHVGNFADAQTLNRWVTSANALKPDLIAVTGDLLSTGNHFVSTLIEGLQKLKATDGVVLCPGNHDYWVDEERFFETLRSAGLELLCNEGRYLARGEDLLYVAGVDDTWTRRHDLKRALAGRLPGTSVVLLAHDPALFPQAAAHDVALTLSGHTHGGQWAVPFFPHWNMSARVFPFTVGMYQHGESRLYVNRGLGTTGPPARIGAAPELAVFTLRSL